MRHKLNTANGAIFVYLSKRNLLALLEKVDDPKSDKILVKKNLFVVAEPDMEHYKNGQEIGPMTAKTEAFIKQHGGKSLEV